MTAHSQNLPTQTTPDSRRGGVFMVSSKEKQSKFEAVLKSILPHLGTHEGRIILAEVMIALKLEGIIGKQLSEHDAKMVGVINQSIVGTPYRKLEALRLAQRLLE
ncbi:MAG: hypothetical protein AB7F28_00840 [Candidatus Margulisiibacteriota bacterium]